MLALELINNTNRGQYRKQVNSFYSIYERTEEHTVLLKMPITASKLFVLLSKKEAKCIEILKAKAMNKSREK